MAKNEPLTAEQLAEIKARAEAATPGPWKRFRMDRFSINNEPLEKHICGVSQESEHDAAFIAHAREDIPALLAEVERLRKQLDGLKKIVAFNAGSMSHPQWEKNINFNMGWKFLKKTALTML